MGDRSQPHDKAGPARPECAETSATTQDSLAPIPLFHRLHMTICQAPGFDPKSFLSLDQMGVLTPPLVKGELRRCMPTLTELDLDRYTTHIAAEIVSGDVSAQGQTKPPFSKTFLILILLDMLGKIPVFISEGFTDSMLPIDHSHFRGERASRPYAPSLTGVLKRCFDDWTPLKIENFMSMQWVVLSPIFSGTVGNITLYDFDARIIMPFVYDNLVCLPYGKIDGHNHVRKVKIHPSHHNFEQNQEEPYFALKELHCKTTEEFKYEVAMLRQSAVNARSSFISPLAVFRHGTSFYSLSPWNDDMLSYSKETSLGLARRDSLSKWVIQHGREIAAALNEVDHDSDPAAETKVSAESIKTGISSCDSNEGVELDDIVWLGSSTYSNGPPTAVNTIGLEKLYTRLEAGLPDEQPCAHTSLEDDVKGHSPGPAWFIGCVLLEDIAWMLHGFEEVVSFSLCPIASKAQDESASMKDGGSPEGAATLPMGYHRPSAVQTGRGQVENIAKRSYFVDLVRLTQKEFMNINWKTGDGAALIIDALRHLQAELPKPPTPTRTTALHLTVADGSSIRSHPVSIVESLEFCSPPVTPILSNLEDNAERPNRGRRYPSSIPQPEQIEAYSSNIDDHEPQSGSHPHPSANRPLPSQPPQHQVATDCHSYGNLLEDISSSHSKPYCCFGTTRITGSVKRGFDSFNKRFTRVGEWVLRQKAILGPKLKRNDMEVRVETHRFEPTVRDYVSSAASRPDSGQLTRYTLPGAVGPSSQKRGLNNTNGTSGTESAEQRKKVRRERKSLTDHAPRHTPATPIYPDQPEPIVGVVPELSEVVREDTLFACPFYKRNPGKFNGKCWKLCSGPGWNIPRLKEHIYRKHFSSIHRCGRCFAEFETMSDLDQHHRLDLPCSKQDPTPEIDMIDEAQKAQIQKKLRGISDEQKWIEIYKIIFKAQSGIDIPSPHYENTADNIKGAGEEADNTNSLVGFEAYIRRLVDSKDQQEVTVIRGCLDLIQNFRRTKPEKTSPSPSGIPRIRHGSSDSTTGLPVYIPASTSLGEDAASQNLDATITGEVIDRQFNDPFQPDQSNSMLFDFDFDFDFDNGNGMFLASTVEEPPIVVLRQDAE